MLYETRCVLPSVPYELFCVPHALRCDVWRVPFELLCGVSNAPYELRCCILGQVNFENCVDFPLELCMACRVCVDFVNKLDIGMSSLCRLC